MRLRDTVVKRSLGRLSLHDLRSGYWVELDQAALAAIEAALRGEGGRGAGLLARLAMRGLVVEGAYEPLERRDASDLLALEIEPLSRCNLSCGHCFVRFSGASMSEAVFAAALEGARQLGAVELVMNGGEPLLHERCLDWIDAARGAALRVVLFSNATRVDAACARRLARAGVAKVIVSLDGFAREHDGLRGAGAFAAAEAGIRELTAAGLAVWITTVVHPGNEASVAALARHCTQVLGARGMRRTTVMPLGRAARRADLALSDQGFRQVYGGEVDCAAGRGDDLLPCAAGIDKLYVRADGGVFACHLFEQAGDQLGSLPRDDLAAIHGGALAGRWPYRGFAAAGLTGCMGCPELERCAGGCRARAWLMTGQPRGRDPIACRRAGR